MDRAKLLERFEKGHALLEATLRSLYAAHPNEKGTLDQWSVKDTLAHITAWQSKWVDWLRPLGVGKELDPEEPPHLTESEDEVNPGIFTQNQARPWNDVLDESRRVFQQFVALVPQLADAQLEDPNAFGWSEGRSLLRRLAGAFYWHPEAHVVDLCLLRGDVERGIKIAEAFTLKMGAEDSPAEKASAIYNLGCFYSRVGRTENAIEMIQAAFSLDPDLIEWSKQDPDLDPLRTVPRFVQLYRS